MVRELTPKGVMVPDGFAVTAEGYRYFIGECGLDQVIRDHLEGLDTGDVANLQQRGRAVREAIMAASIPEALAGEITDAFEKLVDGRPPEAGVAVRSSATAEDLPDASFAGQQETFLHITSAQSLLTTCIKCFASLFTDRAISYRVDKGFDHFDVALSIGVQQMVRADLACSGVMFTIDTESGFTEAVMISAAWGLGENVVQGAVTPDEYVVFKPTLRQGFNALLKKSLGSKELRMVYQTDPSSEDPVVNEPVSIEDRQRFALEDSEVLKLAGWACLIEEHYSRRKGTPAPMDLEWARDGLSGELFILQARPETVQSTRNQDVLETFRLQKRGTVLVEGRSVGNTIASGRVRVIEDVGDIGLFEAGEILVTDRTDPDWQPIMKKAAAIVTNRGGRTCHAAIVSRELGVPAIVGTGNATELLKDGQLATVSCAEGETGYIYDGELPFEVDTINLRSLGQPRTRMMMNIANPENAFALSMIPNDGVGLARMEFIVTNHIRIHPMALVQFDSLEDVEARKTIEDLTAGYADKPQFFVDRLAQGIATIAAAFYPRDVILRLSDFKSNEYANLIGGRPFEPDEQNPMLGFRGACRYYHLDYRDGFALECRAVKKVRTEMGLTNLKVMIPFCRTVEEGVRVQEEMARHGLKRGQDDLELYVMCEIPSNVILAEEFAEIFDGFSIGSNDLTQLVLGVDRDSEIVATEFDERNPAVLKVIAQVIATCRARGRKIGICGQAPSDYPEFTRFLVEQGIDSISLIPDTLLKTRVAVLETERKLESSSPSKVPGTGTD
jgi:pyruvate,water dikinase